jgi:hypothetical protein
MMMSNYRVRVLYASSEPVNPRYLTETTKELTHVIKELKRILDRSRPPSNTDYGL